MLENGKTVEDPTSPKEDEEEEGNQKMFKVVIE